MADVEYQREKPNDEDSGMNSCIGGLIWIISMILIICTFPFSLCVCVKMVQEYERAVIFRLGRVKKGLTYTYSKVFLLCQIWIINYYVKNPVKNLSVMKTKTGVVFPEK